MDTVSLPWDEELELRALGAVRDVDCFVFHATFELGAGADNGELADLTLGGLFAQTECELVAREAEVGEEVFPTGDTGLSSDGNDV